MVRTAAAVVLVVTVLLVGASAAAAAEIQVCEHKNYGGRCVTLLHGVNDLRDWGMSNTISSFRIRSGVWRMCSAPNLQGACQDFTRSVSDLSGTRLQDTVSSLRPVRSGSGGGATAIVVYTAPNFRGRSLVFSDDISDLRRVGLNDRIASVRVLGGRWVICTDINYVGCRSIAADVPDLGAVGWGSRISSIREGQNWWNAGRGIQRVRRRLRDRLRARRLRESAPDGDVLPGPELPGAVVLDTAGSTQPRRRRLQRHGGVDSCLGRSMAGVHRQELQGPVPDHQP